MTTRLTKDDRKLIWEALGFAINDQIDALDANRNVHGQGADEAEAETREFLLKASALKQRLREDFK